MKTSFDLPEPLLREVKALAKKRGTTTKSLVEQALIRILEDDEHERTKPYVLPDCSVDHGTGSELDNLTPAQLREVAYGYYLDR
jgi:hypothetical protein